MIGEPERCSPPETGTPPFSLRRKLMHEPFGPLDSLHTLSLLPVPIKAARLPQRGLGRSQVLGSGSTSAFCLLCSSGTSAGLALHILWRSGTSLGGLVHSRGRRMLLADRLARPR